MDFQPPFLALFVAAVADVILGSAWYGPLFGQSWMQLTGKKEEDLTSFWWWLLISFCSALVVAFILVYMMDYAHMTVIPDALIVAFWIWLGFMIIGSIPYFIWPKKSLRVYLIDMGYDLIRIIVMAIIITSFPR